MYLDAAKCVRTNSTSQREHVGPKPKEDLRFIDKGTEPLTGWAVDSAGAFPADADGNRYLFVFVDPFSKWVEVALSPSLHSWRAAHALYSEVMARWGKPRYVRTDNGSEYKGSFARLCGGMGITRHYITPGNSKANGQVERVIRTIKEVIRRGLTEQPDSFWSDHLPAALLLLRHTAQCSTHVAPITCLTGRRPALPSTLQAPLPEYPAEPTRQAEDDYYDRLYAHMRRVHVAVGQQLHAMEQRLRQLFLKREEHLVSPATLQHFAVGQQVIRRQSRFSKLTPRASLPYTVTRVTGQYG